MYSIVVESKYSSAVLKYDFEILYLSISILSFFSTSVSLSDSWTDESVSELTDI